MKNPELSIIIPVYNEERNIPLMVDRLKKYIKKYSFELVFVTDDGSSKETKEIIKKLSQKNSFVKAINSLQKGYGASIFYGLKKAKSDFLCWTHADLQAPPEDTLKALTIIKQQPNPQKSYIKGKRYGRPLGDSFFTFGMSVFETIILKRILYDINAQPNIFHRSFLDFMKSPPEDFSFDLYAYYLAKSNGYRIIRFPVEFGKRIHGHSAWNFGLSSKIKFIKRTIKFSFKLRERLKRGN